MKEFDDLEPSLSMLMDREITIYGEAEAINAAVKKVYAWLQRPQSMLRALTALLSGGGLFYLASVHETCHRAYIAHGLEQQVPDTDYAMWARARLCEPERTQAAVPNDLEALL